MSLHMFDSHAHYYDERFAEEQEGGARALLDRLFGEGVDYVINVATNNDNAASCLAQAQAYPRMYAAVGIHPSDSRFYPDAEGELTRLEALVADSAVRKEKKIVALGEIGLDYHYENTDKALQSLYFDRQMAMAEAYGLPVVIHDREAHGDCFDMVLKYPRVIGVFHSYSGSVEMMRELVRRGWYISFSGVVTFKNANKVKEVAAAVPADRLLVETDCPYLAPHPHRGQLNHSGRMAYTVAALAELHGCSAEEMARRTGENAKRLFGIV